MNFNIVSTLLAVSSAHDTIHVFKLGPQKSSNGNGKSSSSQSGLTSPSSPAGSLDSRDVSEQGLDGGYDAFIEKKKNGSVS